MWLVRPENVGQVQVGPSVVGSGMGSPHRKARVIIGICPYGWPGEVSGTLRIT